MVHVFTYLLLSANNTDTNWRGNELLKGQVITGRKSISDATGLSEQTVRTCLRRLENSGEICQKSTNKFTIITICKYADYQEYQPTNQPTTNQQLTSNQPQIKNIRSKEVKEDKEKKLFDAIASKQKRQEDFYNSLVPYVKIYSKEMVKAFYDYWSESNKSGTKMKFEMEKTWELPRRLTTWSNNEFRFNKTQKEPVAPTTYISGR